MSESREIRPTVLADADQRVLLLLSSERDRDLLASRLADRYEVAVGAPDADWDAFDLCVVDASTYRRVEDDLTARKSDTNAYLPVLLLVPDQAGSRRAEWVAEELDGTVDDVLVVPAPKHELDARAAALLRARRQSLRLALFRRAMDEAAIGITITDPGRPDNPIVYANDGFCRTTGYEREAVIGRNCRFLQGPETDERMVDRIRAAIDSETPVTVELRNYRADGEPFWNLLTITPVRDDEGRVTHFLGFQRDITERRELESDLRTEREMLEQVFDTSPVGITVVDTDGDIVRANEAAQRELGLERSEITSRTFDDPAWEMFDTDGEPIPSEEMPVNRVLQTGEVVEDYRHGIRVDGEERWLSVNSAPMTDEDGDVEAVVNSVQNITDRVERERELERYETLVKTMTDATWVFDADGRITLANRKFMARVPLPWDDAIGRHVTEFEPMFADAETFQEYHGLLEDVIGGRLAEASIDVGFEAPDGTLVANLRLAPIPGPDGPSGAAVVARDITDRVERERELERYETIVKNISDAAVVYDEDKRIEFVNREFLDPTPEPREAVIGRHAEDLDHLFADPETHATYCDVIDDLLAGRREEATLDVVFDLPDDHLVVNVSMVPISGDDGPVGVIVVGRDITDRVERERELERYETIVQTTTDPIYVVDTEGRFVRVNDAMVEASGYDRGELLGSHVSMVADQEMVDRAEAIIRDLLEGDRERATFESEMVFADGTRREYATSLAILREDGEFQGTVVAAHDVTDLHAHQRRLTVLDRVLRHNLRNRMNVVKGYATQLADHSDPEVADVGAAIEQSAAELLKLAESARDFESVISGTAEQTTTTDVAAVVETAVADVRSEHPTADVSTDLPDAAPARTHETFELAVAELLENAIIHSDREVPAVEVSVGVADGEVEVRVADDGPGLDDIDRRALMSGTESPLEHTQGLGLWLVRWTVESVGGVLDIDDNDPRGTVVTVSLPRAPG